MRKHKQLSMCITALAVGLLSAVAMVANAGTTLMFQDGVNGYDGTRDQSIRWDYPQYYDWNNGGDTVGYFAGLPYLGYGYRRSALIAFDDIFGAAADQIPADDPSVTVVEATLEIYVNNKVTYGSSNYVQLWPMATDWVEGTTAGWGANDGESTGSHRYYSSSGVYDTGDFWGTGGVVTQGPVEDVDYDVPGTSWSTYSFTAEEPDYTGEWFAFTVTAAVQAWVDGVIDNNGFYGFANGPNQRVDWYPSDYTADPSLRPKLTVEYTPEPTAVALLLLGLPVLFRRRKV